MADENKKEEVNVQNNSGQQDNISNENIQVQNVNVESKNKSLSYTLKIVAIAIIVGVVIGYIVYSGYSNRNRAIKVDIQMTNYYGHIDYILNELGLDFDLVTGGANCYTGVHKSEFKTEKYGILHTEFRYCKVNSTTIFRVYNTEQDQKLRDPKPGELATFDSYGYKKLSSDSL